MESIVYIDTHIAIWLYAGKLDMFSKSVIQLLNQSRICISEIVRLEIKYLQEIGRINESPDKIIKSLISEIGLEISTNSYETIVSKAINFDFTRDPFDRIIVADASILNMPLVSKDSTIQNNYRHTIW